MDAIRNIGNLIEKVTGKIETVIDAREGALAEISSLREQLAERDKEAVKTAQDMMTELEAARIDAFRFERERARIEEKLQTLNDRLIALVGDKSVAEAEPFGG